MYRSMAQQTASALQSNHNEDDSTKYLKEIVYELRNNKSKPQKSILTIRNNQRWEKWNASIERDVRGRN